MEHKAGLPDATLQIGIDFSQKRADVGLFGPGGEPILSHRAFANSHTGYLQFRTLVLETMQTHGFGEMNVSGEATSTYWLPFFMQLVGDPQLNAYPLHPYLLNPRWVKWFKKCFAPDNKTDQGDPFYIAERTRTRPPSYEWALDPEWLKLRWYTRYRFHLVRDLTRQKNFYQAYLFVLNSAYAQQSPFSDLFGASSRKILQTFTTPLWADTLDAMQITQQLEGLDGQRFTEPLQTAQALLKIRTERFPIEEGLAVVLQRILNLELEHIQATVEQIEQVNGWIAQEAALHPSVGFLDSIPGIGPVFSSGIAAEIGDLNRFLQGQKWDARHKRYRQKDLRDVDAAIAKLAGLWWPRSESGDFAAEDRRLAKSGNRYLRYYLIEAANSLRQYSPAYARFYHKKFAEVNKHRHKRALVLTARKSIRLYAGLLHRQEGFCSKEAHSSS